MRKSSDLKTLPTFEKLRNFLSGEKKTPSDKPSPTSSPRDSPKHSPKTPSETKSGGNTPRSARDLISSSSEKRLSVKRKSLGQAILDVFSKSPTSSLAYGDLKNHFGVRLTSMMKQEEDSGKPVPRILDFLFTYLIKNGVSNVNLFRSESQREASDDLALELDGNLDAYIKGKDFKVAPEIVGEVLVKWLHYLPITIINGDVYSKLVLTSEQLTVETLAQEIRKLPSVNQAVLKKVVELLYVCSQYGKVNGLTSKVLAERFGPRLMKMDKEKDVSKIHLERQVTLFMIRKYPLLFNPTEEERAIWDKVGDGKTTWPDPLTQERAGHIFQPVKEDAEVPVPEKKKKDISAKLTMSLGTGKDKKEKVILKKGTLKMKQNRKIWKEVFLVLRSDKLYLYDSFQDYVDGNSQFAGIFINQGVVTEIEQVEGHKWVFSVYQGNMYFFEASTESEMNDWKRTLVEVVNGTFEKQETGKIVIKNRHEQKSIVGVRERSDVVE